MKSFVFEDCLYKYRVVDIADDPIHTEFYRGLTSYEKRKYGLLGPVIAVQKPKLVFKIYGDVENPLLSKEHWATLIRAQEAVEKRKNEIANGYIAA